MLVGAIRWIERRPAINHHARAHLGGCWLRSRWRWPGATCWSRTTCWPDRRNYSIRQPGELTANLSPVLAGIALAAGGISALWAARPRHALVVSCLDRSGCIIDSDALVAAFHAGGNRRAGAGQCFDGAAIAGSLRAGAAADHRSGHPSGHHLRLWCPPSGSAAALARAMPGDSGHLVSVNRALLTPGGRRRRHG